MNVFLGKPPAGIEAWIKSHQPTPPTSGPLLFTAQQDGSSVSLAFQDYGMPDANPPILQYSLNDTEHWTDYGIGETIPIAKDAKVYFQAKTENDRISAPPLDGPPMQYKFIMQGSIAASGNINSLLTNDSEKAMTMSLAGKDWCYANMFNGCTSLTQAPELPATTLASYCYVSMFD